MTNRQLYNISQSQSTARPCRQNTENGVFKRDVCSEGDKICLCPKSELPNISLRGQRLSRRTQESSPDRVSNSVQDCLHALDPSQGLTVSWISNHNELYLNGISNTLGQYSISTQPGKLTTYKPS